MSGRQKVWAILFVCVALASVAKSAFDHQGCLAICINNASAGN